MFERNRIDNAPDLSAVPIEVTFADGTLVKGKMLLPLGKHVAETLNGPASFIEFEPYGGERCFVAKAQVAAVKLVGMPKAASLASRVRDLDGFDPYSVLGVAAGTPPEQIHASYVKLAKAYHPDRYATADLPDEVRDYLSAMARRVNSAYAALETPRHVKAARQAPIFQSGPRA